MITTPLYDRDHTIHVHSQVVDNTSAKDDDSDVLEHTLDAGVQITSGHHAVNLDFGIYTYMRPDHWREGPRQKALDYLTEEIRNVHREREALARLVQHVNTFQEAFLKATDDILTSIDQTVIKITDS